MPLILMLFISLNVFAQEVVFKSADETTVGPGDILEVRIIAKDFSQKQLEKLEAIAPKQLTYNIYLRDIEGEGGFYEGSIIISEPDKKFGEGLKLGKDNIVKYELKNFQIKDAFVKEKEAFIYDSFYSRHAELWWVYLLIALSLSLIAAILVKYSKNQKLKKEYKQKQKMYLDRIESLKTRADYEGFYKERSEILSVFNFSENKFKKFSEELDRVQYKPQWSIIEQEQVTKVFKEFKSTISEKRWNLEVRN